MDINKIVSSEVTFCPTQELLEVYYSNPNSRKVLIELFPKLKEYSKPYIRVGILLKDKARPDNIFTLVVIDGFVRMINITTNYAWKESIKVSNLLIKHHWGDVRFNEIFLTKYEFMKLVSKSRMESFCVFDMKKKEYIKPECKIIINCK